MKKSLLALSVVGALTLGAAHAETTLYGSIRFDYANNKNEHMGDLATEKPSGAERVSNLRDQGSRIGLKGGEDLGNGLQLIYHLEWGFDGMEGLSQGDGFHNRLAYVGLAGDWGTAVVGRLDNPFKQTLVDGSVRDDFNGNASQSATMRAVSNIFAGGITVDGTFVNNAAGDPIAVAGASTQHHFATDGSLDGFSLDRVGNAIAYLSPNWSGFSFNAAIIMDNDLVADVDPATGQQKPDPTGPGLSYKKHVDIFTLNAIYEHESGIYGKLGYMQGYTSNTDSVFFGKQIFNNRKASAFGLQLGWRTDQFGVSAAYADAKLSNRGAAKFDTAADTAEWEDHKDKAKAWEIGGSFSFGDNYASTVRLTYGEARYTADKNTSNAAAGALTSATSHRVKPKEKMWALGFEHKLSDRTRVWVEYDQTKLSGNHGLTETTVTGGAGGTISAKSASSSFAGKNQTLSIGIRHDF